MLILKYLKRLMYLNLPNYYKKTQQLNQLILTHSENMLLVQMIKLFQTNGI